MKRSAIWCAAFALAWRSYRVARIFGDGPPQPPSHYDEGEPIPAQVLGLMCARDADACEAAYVAAFGEPPA